jgi:hypothetical protein
LADDDDDDDDDEGCLADDELLMRCEPLDRGDETIAIASNVNTV